jgi:iron complex outermembrane receptor protein
MYMQRKKSSVEFISSVALFALAIGSASPALAQSVVDDEDEEAVSEQDVAEQSSGASTASGRDPEREIIVTGSSLRGAPAVGSNLISIGEESIEDNAVQTVQQLLQTVPQIWGSNTAGQGAFGSFDASGLAVPQIHGLGGANSSSTLVVIDGHRFPTMGVRRNLADPNFIPPNAIQRVEVLAEGASSIYGSDAVAGVLNFITKRRFDGVELSGQAGFGDDYRTWSASASLGRDWGDGGAAVFYNYSDRGDLLGADRPLTLPDQRARGGRNFGSFNCGPTSFQPAGSSEIYLYPYTGSGIQNSQANAPCENASVTALIPEEKRHSVMVKIDHDVNDRLSLAGDVVYSTRVSNQKISVGNITATVFGPGSGQPGQSNPFFIAPAGTGATRGTARFNGDELFPDGANVRSGIEVFYGHGNATYELNDNWALTGFIVQGMSISSETRTGELCGACVLLAVNGSTNGNGSLTQPAIPGTNLVVNNLPLTTANALDIWTPRQGNRTSPEVLARIRDSRTFQRARQEIQQYNLKLDGTLFTLPAGELRAAIGGDMVKLSVDSEVAEANNTGPTSVSSSYNAYLYERTVKSVFAEALIPVISADMGVPLINSLDFNVSGRYDYYDEFGGLFNPKFAFNWEVFPDLKIRGNYAESFVAPQFSTYGPDKLTGERGRSVDTYFGPQRGTLVIPLDKYPEARSIAGCNTPGQVTCTLGTASIAGMRLEGANPDVGPATGKAWALGLDYTPSFLQGLNISLTYWHNTLEDAAGSPPLAIVVNSDRFHDLLTIFPDGATPAQIEAYRGGRRQNNPLSSGPIYFGLDFRNYNVYTVFVEGIDFDAHYLHDFAWGIVKGGVAGTYKTRFDQTSGPGEPVFSILNRNRYLGTFPSTRLDLRADLSIETGPFKGSVFANHTGGYTFFHSNAINPVTTENGIPTGGGDPVEGYTSVSLNLQYDLAELLPFEATVYVDVDNLLDTYPPFVNFNTGFDNFVTFPMGRVITAGFRTRF